MQTLTKNEISWIISAVTEHAEAMQKMSETDQAFSGVFGIRAVGLTILADKLRKALEDGNKRIDIKY